VKKRINLTTVSAMLLSIISIFILSASIVFSIEPTGPDTITDISSGRHTNNSVPYTLQAKAGNVTALVIDSVRATEAWQGYYGNVTGTITLDDADNFTLYDWSIPTPQGEIYASNHSTVTWSEIFCVNLSHTNGTNSNGETPGFNYTSLELDFGINETDMDGVNETFNDTYVDATGFRVGNVQIDSTDGCSMTHPYTTQAYSTAWEELLLTDNTSIVFTSLIRDSADGFQDTTGDTYDFQMLVLENGHVGAEQGTTPYYFFVELS
jgi:hypothetical protein